MDETRFCSLDNGSILNLGVLEGPYVNLLWTGGWDSTFRLLQLLFDSDVEVQPWYLLDRPRVSTPREQRAMADILEALRKAEPARAARVRPVRTVTVDTLQPAPDVSEMASRLRLGSQYEWLARFAREYGLDGLELSVESRPGRVQAMLGPVLDLVPTPAGMVPRVSTKRIAAGAEDSDLLLFAPFAFPIIHVTKRGMLEEARRRGWEPYLAHTWFCHKPKGGRPCGSCDPCLIAVEEGFAGRIPVLRRIRPRLRLLKRDLIAWRARLKAPRHVAAPSDGPR